MRACVRVCVRAGGRAWTRSYSLNFRPGDVSWERNMQMLMRFPLGGFTDGSTLKNTIEWYYGIRALNDILDSLYRSVVLNGILNYR